MADAAAQGVSDPSYTYKTYSGVFAYANNVGQAITGDNRLYHAGNLTPINMPGATRTTVQGVNASGIAYGYGVMSDDSTTSFSFDGKTYTSLALPHGFVGSSPAFFPLIEGIDAAGDVTGNNVGRTGGSSFLLKGSVSISIAPPDDYSKGKGSPDQTYTIVAGITQSGTVFGSFYNNKTAQLGSGPVTGFTYRDGTYTNITPPGHYESRVTGINGANVIVGDYDDYQDGYLSHGFVDVNGTFTVINVPGAKQTFVLGVNDAGEVFGYDTSETGSYPTSTQGFVCKDGVYTTVAAPESTKTTIMGVTADGMATGDYNGSDGTAHGFFAAFTSPVGGAGNGQTYTVGAGQSLTVTGSADTVNPTGAGASVMIGGNGQFASDANDDLVHFGAPGAAVVTDGSRVELFGDRVTATIGANDTVGLYGSGNRLAASGADDHVFLGGNGQFATDANDNFVTFAQGGVASVFSDARAELRGDGITADMGARDTVGLYGGGNTLVASGAGDAVWIGGNGRNASQARDDLVTFLQGGTVTVIDDSRADLFGNGITALIGADDLVGLIGRGANVTVNGAGSTVFVGGNGRTGADADVDRVGFARGGLAIVTDQARVAVTGDGLGVLVGADDTVTLTGTGDTVTMTGTGSTVSVAGGGGHLLLGGAGADIFGFGASFGKDTVQAFQATGTNHDTLSFDHTVFASVDAILRASTQMGADVVITAGPNDVIRLQTVSLAALNSGNLKVT